MPENQFNRFIGNKLRCIRQMKGTSQTTLANVLNVSFQQVQKYESGTNNISLEKLVLAASFFNVEINYFVPQNNDLNLDASPNAIDKKEAELIKIFNKIKSPHLRNMCLNTVRMFVEKEESTAQKSPISQQVIIPPQSNL